MIIYYSIIRMDLADHPRGLLFASITVGSADGPYGLLFLHCHRSGRPPQRFIILVNRYSIGRWRRLFIILFDHPRVLLYVSITVGSADGPYGLLFLHCHRSGRPPRGALVHNTHNNRLSRTTKAHCIGSADVGQQKDYYYSYRQR